MLSWPPATTMALSPVRICCAASATARRPEPQTWLMPKAVFVVGNAGGAGRLARRVLALRGGQHLAEDHLVHLAGLELGALDRGLDGGGAELVRGDACRTRR